MKRIVYSIIASIFVLLPLLLRAQSTPESVMKTFFKAIQKKDIEAAKKVTHSSFHGFLNMMADAQMKEGADTVDRNDYTSLQFKPAGKGGTIKYKSGDAEDMVFLAKENGEWKVDLFGTVGEYGFAMFLIEYSTESEEPLTHTLEIEYEIGGHNMRKKTEAVLKPSFPIIRQFPADNIKYLRIAHTPATENVQVSISKAKSRSSDEVEEIVKDANTTNGIFEWKRK